MDDGSKAQRKSGEDSGPGKGFGRTIFDWAHDTGATKAVLREMDAQVRRRRKFRRLIRRAVSTLVILLVMGWAWHSRPAFTSSPSVAISAPTRQHLSDGSVVLLRGGAELRLNFSHMARQAELSKGEALFEVAKDPGRPFVVRVGGVDIRAVGTAFAVRLTQAEVEILVTEGRIAVVKPDREAAANMPDAGRSLDENPAAAAGTLALVDAGNRVSVEIGAEPAAPHIQAVTETEINARLAWRVPKLQFSRTPLAEAIPMVNQHSHVRLVLEGAGMDRVKLSGTIRADNVSALLQLLAADYGIEVEWRGENEIVLSRAP